MDEDAKPENEEHENTPPQVTDLQKTSGNNQQTPEPEKPRHLIPIASTGDQKPDSDAPDGSQEVPNNLKGSLTPGNQATPSAENESLKSTHPTPSSDGEAPVSPKLPEVVTAFSAKGNRTVQAHKITKIIHKHYYSEARKTQERDPAYALNGQTQDAPGGQPKSLLEITTTLDQKPSNVPGYHTYSPQENVEKLKEECLLFISSAGDRVALGAAYCLIDELGVDGNDRRLLDFDRFPSAEFNLYLHYFSNHTNAEEEKNLTAIVVDGFHDQARPFLDWLVRTTEISAMKIRRQLKENRLLMLCLVDESYIPSHLGFGKPSSTFAVWNVPFLRPLLKHYFPQDYLKLERQVRQQQSEGKWERTDNELYKQIRQYLDGDNLQRLLEVRDSAEATRNLSNLPEFKGNQPIQDSLLYVATYFPDLAPHEFDRVVSSLIGEKTTTVTVKSSRKNKDGETEIVETEVEKPLLDFWNSDPDSYLCAGQLEAVSGPDSTTVIDFVDPTWRQELKARLEKRHSVYLMRQFQVVKKEGLLFNSTPSITGNVMRLIIDMAITHPNSFGKHWLFETTIAARANGDRVVEERIPQLLRLMLEKPQLEEMVVGLLKELMASGDHDLVINIIKGLQFAPRFDEFFWIKRLLDESNGFVRDETYYHLYSYIKKIGIHPLLAKLDAWLPSAERFPEAYSSSTMYAIRLLVEYCSETTESFDARFYGLAQPVHPLLVFLDEVSARDHIGRLIKWLFHPGMEIVFADLESVLANGDFKTYHIPLICELVAEWMFVLHGRAPHRLKDEKESAASGEMPSDSESSECYSDLNAATVRDILLQEIVKATNAEQRDRMITYWEQLRDFMAFILSLDRNSESPAAQLISLILNLNGDSDSGAYQLDYKAREEIRWRRELVKDLLKRFRGAIRAHQLASPRTAVV